jgi:hypothetical protein
VRELTPTSNGSRWRAPSHYTLACLGLCALIVIVAAVDYAHVASRLPEVPPRDCESRETDCFEMALQEQLARDRAADPLEDQYNSRAWLYAFGMLAGAAVATAYALRSRPRNEWPRIFTNLGVIGVWAAIAVIVLLLLTGDASISIRAAPTLTIPVLLLVAAAVGTLVGRSEGWAAESPADGARASAITLGKLAIHIGTGGAARRSRIEALGRWFIYAALGLTALTALLTFIFAGAQPECGTGDSPPHWTDPVDSVAAVTGVIAIAAGIGGLILRRWIAALISLIVNPIAFLFILASTCAFY